MSVEAVHLGTVAVLVSAVLPTVMICSRRRVGWDRLALPAITSAAVFVVVHAGYATLVLLRAPAPIQIASDAALAAAGVLYWLPVIGQRRRLPGPGQFAYLFLSQPFIDVMAVALIVCGHNDGGVAMIVGMIPFGLAAVAVTVRWVLAEERDARRQELFDFVAGSTDPDSREDTLCHSLNQWTSPSARFPATGHRTAEEPGA